MSFAKHTLYFSILFYVSGSVYGAGDTVEKPPVFISAHHIEGITEQKVEAEGEVELRQHGKILTADKLVYSEVTDEVEATGNVRLKDEGNIINGPKLKLKIADSIGYFEQPSYILADSNSKISGSGHADLINFEGERHYRLKNSTYSTCIGDDPDWYTKTQELVLDYDKEKGVGRGAKVVFKDVPILYSPWLEFSLNNKRKSGMLPPTIGGSSRTGTELTLPYYWNIASNMDATLAPSIMPRRGVLFNNELRYLNKDYQGEAHLGWLPSDALLNNERRSAYSLVHSQALWGGLSASLNLNGVSDDAYFRDLSGQLGIAAQTNLLRQASFSYGAGWWSATANIQRYQTLQDPLLALASKPYERIPQVLVTASRPDIKGMAFNFNGEFVNFGHPSNVVGSRTILYPQLGFPYETPSFYLLPKIGLHMTRYDLSRQATGVPSQINRNIPMFSADTAVTFEKDTRWFGQNMVQTLEPRLYYLYVPARDQSQIPNFDTGLNDFNFATIFSENVFSGGDRIADANQLTAAMTSRLIQPDTGKERIRGVIGQRYYFKEQEVVLPGSTPRVGKSADVLASLSGEMAPKIFLDAGWQYNPRDAHTEKWVIGGRYQPDFAKVLNASYRFTRNTLQQIDISGQWPLGLLGRGWYGVGRYNYSVKDKQLVESVGGLEYNGGCWVARAAFHRYASAATVISTAFFLQLELNGFAQLGVNPLDTLKHNIPGYGLLGQSVSP